VPDPQVSLGPARRPLPEAAVAALHAAFADEVAVRLPRLRAERTGPQALRDAHTLGSSAVVVGALPAARAARALEAELTAAAPDPDAVDRLLAELERALA
jgi:HPt (histidine-containing phosphotransfer) domain-containing protein